MRSISDSDMRLYAGQMEQIKARVAAAEVFLSMAATYPVVEAALLQVRQSLEVLGLASLITNRYDYDSVGVQFCGREHNDAIKLARRINPNFWPVPSTQQLDPAGRLVAMVPVVDGFLHEDECLRTWGQISDWLHATSSFETMPDPSTGAALALQTIGKVRVLLNHHTIQLVDRDELIACIMNERTSGNVHVTGFTRVDAPAT